MSHVRHLVKERDKTCPYLCMGQMGFPSAAAVQVPGASKLASRKSLHNSSSIRIIPIICIYVYIFSSHDIRSVYHMCFRYKTNCHQILAGMVPIGLELSGSLQSAGNGAC